MRSGWTGLRLGAVVRGGLVLGVAAALAGGISAIQLLPTLELSRLSIRGGGLSYQIASFDALPWPLLLPALVPGLLDAPADHRVLRPPRHGAVRAGVARAAGGAGRPAVLGAVYVALGLLLAVGDATLGLPLPVRLGAGLRLVPGAGPLAAGLDVRAGDPGGRGHRLAGAAGRAPVAGRPGDGAAANRRACGWCWPGSWCRSGWRRWSWSGSRSRAGCCWSGAC